MRGPSVSPQTAAILFALFGLGFLEAVLNGLELGRVGQHVVGRQGDRFACNYRRLPSLVGVCRFAQGIAVQGCPVRSDFEGQVYGEDFVKQLAKLPSRKELLTQLVLRMNSPIQGFANVLGALTRNLVVALEEVRKKKAATGAAS